MTIWNILIAVSMWLVLLFSAGITQGCTIKVDNPFYAPSTLDVNKATSTGANNYLGGKKDERPL